MLFSSTMDTLIPSNMLELAPIILYDAVCLFMELVHNRSFTLITGDDKQSRL